MNFYVTLKIKNKWLHRKIFFSWYKRVVNELANNKTFFNNSSYIMQVPCTTFFDNVLPKYHRFNTKFSLSLSLYSLPKFIKDYPDCIKLMQNGLLIARKCIYIWWWHFNVASLFRWYHQHCHRDTTFYWRWFCYLVQLHITISSIAFITSFVRLERKSMQFYTNSFHLNTSKRFF